MKRLFTVLITMVLSFSAEAAESCKSNSLDLYKAAIKKYEVVDKKLPVLPDGARFTMIEMDNCYVKISVLTDRYSEKEYQYLFNPRGELVNVVRPVGMVFMTCRGLGKRGHQYFSSLLEKNRKENASLPSGMKYPKGYSIRLRGCLVVLNEYFQDDLRKPLLVREWVFDQNDELVRFGELKRNPKKYPDDPTVK